MGSFALPFISSDSLYYRGGKLIIVICLIMGVVTLFEEKYNNVDSVLNYLGLNSIWIYLFHSYFTAVSRVICNKIIPNYIFLRILICTMMGLIGPLILGYVMRKLKVDFIIVKPISIFERFKNCR